MAPRSWTCRKCKHVNPSKRTKKCAACGKVRPKTKRPPHMVALGLSYEEYVKINGGEHCGICETKPSNGRRLDRDHDHKTARPRGLLCHRHNRALKFFDDNPDLLEAAAEYLRRPSVETLASP